MAVVVNRHGNQYYAHRIVLPDGTAFRFAKEQNNAAQELSRGVTVSGSLADTTSAASNASIADAEGFVNTGRTFQEEVRAQMMGENSAKEPETDTGKQYSIRGASELQRQVADLAEQNRRLTERNKRLRDQMKRSGRVTTDEAEVKRTAAAREEAGQEG